MAGILTREFSLKLICDYLLAQGPRIDWIESLPSIGPTLQVLPHPTPGWLLEQPLHPIAPTFSNSFPSQMSVSRQLLGALCGSPLLPKNPHTELSNSGTAEKNLGPEVPDSAAEVFDSPFLPLNSERGVPNSGLRVFDSGASVRDCQGRVPSPSYIRFRLVFKTAIAALQSFRSASGTFTEIRFF